MKSILFGLLLLCYFPCLAQEHSFVKMLSEPALKVIPGLHGSFYTISTQLDCPDDLVIIRHFSSSGATLKTFQSPPYIGALASFDAVTNEKNNLVLYLKLNELNHLLYEFDSLGNIIWNKSYQFVTPQMKFTKLKAAVDGYYLLGTTYSPTFTDSSRAIITKLNTLGNVRWVKYYRMNSALAAMTDFNDMLVEGNQILIAGAYYYTSQYLGQGPYRPIMAVLDTAGNFQSGYYYITDSSSMTSFEKYQFMSLDKTPNGSYYLGARNGGNEHAIFKLDASLNISWVKRAPSGKFTTMCAGYEEDVMIVRDNGWGNLVLRFDSSGNSYTGRRTKAVANDLQYGLVNTIVQHNCGFLLGNSHNMIARTNSQMQFCIDSVQTTMLPTYYPVNNHYRNSISISSGAISSYNQYTTTAQYTVTSSTEASICSGTYNCSGSTTSVVDPELLVSLYPNPANNVLNIRLADDGEVMIYDMSGRVVGVQQLKGAANNAVSVAAMAPGSYLFKVISNNKVMVQKVVVVR